MTTFLIGLVTASQARAQAETPGIEVIPFRLNTLQSGFLTPRGACAKNEVELAARMSYVDRPLAVTAASASSAGSPSAIVKGVLGVEQALVKTWSNGVDMGLSIGAHVYQFGDGATLLTGVETPLPKYGTMDPIVELGYQTSFFDLALRPFIAIYLPLGEPAAFIAEKKARLEGGFSMNHHISWFSWAAEASFLYRSTIQLSNTLWASQARFAVAARAELGAGFSLGPEFLIRPVLSKARHSDPDINRGESPLIPSEALLNVGFESGPIEIRLGYGLGLKLTRISENITKMARVRAPSSPVQHFLLDFKVALGSKRPQTSNR